MKNQYFGDINDYKKYGLLRVLSGGGKVKIAVCWMLTDADNRSDGRFVEYLQRPDIWRAHDPALFDSLAQCLTEPANRGVGWAKEAAIIPGAVYYDTLLTDAAVMRERYFEQLLSFAHGTELVFFDPDNGLEVPSKPKGRRDSSKYLYWDEVERTFAAGHSILAYQHFPRIERIAFLRNITSELRKRTGTSEVISFRTANVAFLLAPQPAHLASFRDRAQQLENTWGHHMHVEHHR